jgi:hypothetical protein
MTFKIIYINRPKSNCMFPSCVYVFKRGFCTGRTCDNLAVNNWGVCSTHLNHVSKQGGVNMYLLSTLCDSKDIDSVTKCLEHMPLTQVQLNNQFKMCLRSRDSKSHDITMLLLSSPKYFPETFGYDFIKDPGAPNSVVHHILYKRFLIKSYIETHMQLFPILKDLLPRFLMPGCYPRY